MNTIKICGRIRRWELQMPYKAKYIIETCSGCGGAWIHHDKGSGKYAKPLKEIKTTILTFHSK